ncbi:bifunctional phosphoribosyl-AMP cyclohydrolase/phosphoribosyl-ATP diphosphatase HisIE [Buchnera aphidicola (Thelaxes californica)]|uniref:Histidine biosynthesis bifunctional protein HisIE n=1 Tax=Buchnera aphidicola (Thelaxes californica) TaxID=1315998 RepID=A0A4D6YKZ2_9GAMM|nr:bifunctional phosphoribosyl-AMP cyclohydrolase/phosphoribosyl-ATP diphosphatase HisIE [Buchnera aphidicola]QCI26644.1 bifunctional phosphoribosyl-AMP cyclohydrolase/phosphoribosyl-ATP diphosphatase HisIE [Buchnera aphidicola (Thelaxes californica)]
MLNDIDILSKIDWKKTNGNVPVIIQNYLSGEVLMHAYMNNVALEKSIQDQEVVLNSRTKKRLWKKGETSGNFLKIKKIISDCDSDCLLIMVEPVGVSCHLNQISCFYSDHNIHRPILFFLHSLDKLIESKKSLQDQTSYTCKLYKTGISRIAQKLGEESIETIIAAVQSNKNNFVNEASDLMYHYLVLLHSKNINIYSIISNLQKRFLKKKTSSC